MPKIIATVIELALSVCVLWVLFFLSTFLHEVGHALGYRISTGDRHWHIRIGWGKILLKAKRLTVKLFPFDGCFLPSEKDMINTTAQLIATLAGGPAVSLILAALLLSVKFGGVSLRSEVLASSAIEFFLNSALFINLFILILSLIPTRYFHGEIKGMETDGLQIIHAIKRHKSKP